MKLIVGLGNPGTQYVKTRHNAGFMAVRAFHGMHSEEFGGWVKKYDAEISEGRAGGQKVVLMMPQTFMNLSGDAVAQAVAFWKIAPADVLMAYDEADIPLGDIRIRATGSAAGHNGVKSMLVRLGTKDVQRIRIGIKTERAALLPIEDYVLEKFSPEEEKLLAPAIERAAQAMDLWLTDGVEAAQAKYGA